MAGPLIESGKFRALAKLDGRKDPYPNVPTLAAAASLQNFDDISTWLSLVAPKATPRPIIEKLNREWCTFSDCPMCGRNSTGSAISPSPARPMSLPRSSATRPGGGGRS
jgi:tripartite-type tricarboxylate transporter receptor subunit TctC